ncbi:MAG: amphi-Trp domain-containing protein [Proteobacteria bacterium]|nr:amphi-Trp domain-containing protein [Pseudomonadota bacterium]
MSEEKFYFDSLQDAESITHFLQALTDGIAKGEITLSTNGDSISLCPQGLLGFMVKAKKKRGANRMTMRISWKDSTDYDGGERPSITVE